MEFFLFDQPDGSLWKTYKSGQRLRWSTKATSKVALIWRHWMASLDYPRWQSLFDRPDHLKWAQLVKEGEFNNISVMISDRLPVDADTSGTMSACPNESHSRWRTVQLWNHDGFFSPLLMAKLGRVEGGVLQDN